MSTDTDSAPAQVTGRRSRAVLWTGIMLGTALAVLAMTDGVRLRIGGMPAFFGWIAGGALVWAITVGACLLIAELLRRHHGQIRRAAARQGGRAARSGWRLARRHGGRGLDAAARWAGPRWADRAADVSGTRPFTSAPFRPPSAYRRAADWWSARRPRRRAVGEPQAGPGPDSGALPGPGAPPPAAGFWRNTDAGTLPAGVDGVMTPPVPGPRRVCVACGNPEGGKWGPLVTYSEPPFPGWTAEPRLIHKAHFEDESTGYYGEPYQPAPVPANPDDPADGSQPPAGSNPNDPGTGGNDMTEQPIDLWPSDGPGGPRRRARGAAAARDVGADWKALASTTGDFEPEDDHHLLTWMAGEAAGMSMYAEAIADAYETAVNTVGLDPVAMAALHDYADTAAEAAEAMAAARQKFAGHYKEVRDFAASGGVLPFDGRWITGEGD